MGRAMKMQIITNTTTSPEMECKKRSIICFRKKTTAKKTVRFDLEKNTYQKHTMPENDDVESRWYTAQDLELIKLDVIVTLKQIELVGAGKLSEMDPSLYCARGLEDLISVQKTRRNNQRRRRQSQSYNKEEIVQMYMNVIFEMDHIIISQRINSMKQLQLNLRELKLAASAINKITQKRAIQFAYNDAKEAGAVKLKGALCA